MISRLVFLLFCGHFAQILGNAGKLPRVKKQSLKVQINVTSDAMCMRYIRPTPSTKLEGFILGYGSSYFSNQYIPLPSNGKMYITEVDAEPRYLIAVRPVSNNKKSCSGKTKTPKPLQLVIGTLTPTSVFLSWGILVNPKHDWTTMKNCPNDRFYTVRYREKDKDKKWILQLCPTTETVVDNLKPNTIYEFGVKDNTDDGIWSKNFIHKVVISGKNKENGELQNNYKFPKIQTQFIPDSKTFVPVKVIKQVLQNITHQTQSEILKKSPLSGPILVHLIVPDFNATKQKPSTFSRLDIFEKPKQSVAKNKTQEWLPESKTSEVKEITPQSQTAMAKQDVERSKPTSPGVSKDFAVSQAHTESEQESSKPSKAPTTEMPPATLDLHKFLGVPKARPSPMPHMPTEPSVSKKMQQVPLKPKTPVPKTTQTKAAVTNEPTLESFPSKTSNTPDWRRAILAPSEIPFITLKWNVSATPERWHDKPVSTLPSVKQNIPKTSRITEKLETSPVPRGGKIPVSKPQFLPHLEEPKITLAVTNKLVPLPATTKISVTDGHPVTTMASKEKNTVPSKSKEFDYTKPEEPDRKFVSPKDDNGAPKVFTTSEPQITKSVSTEDEDYLPKVLTTPDLPITKSDSHKPSPVPPKYKEPDYIMPAVPDTKHDAKTKHPVLITKTTINPLLLPTSEVEEVIFKTEQAKSSAAPKETHEVPTRSKTPFSPDVTSTKSSLNIKYHDPSKPKSHPGQKTQPSKPETTPFAQDLTTMVPVATEKAKETLDPKETRLLPSKPKPSDKQGKNKTKPASSKLNNKVTVTKTPRLRKVVHRTTPAPPRTRTPGGSSWSKKPRGEKLTNEDVANPLHPSFSTMSSVSVDSTVVRKKTDPARPPGSPRPPLAPARPTPIRRRPLPPNNVTGKPGRSGNVLMPRASSFLTTSIAKPTWPSSLVKTSSPKKLPTAAASPDYSNPMFSSIPTSETDIAGTPRYTGDHVKYLKKKDDVPCSITDTMQHFQSDKEENREVATSAPQKPPTNLTVVTVEGCSSFVVLDWKKPENETVTEYKVVSTENGGIAGKDKSITTTNQTHSTVENLKPNTSYEFVVIPSNPLGEGPSSESKPFRTESADPRVTESISMGKDAIWTEVSFNSDDYSECKGKQYVKRTWYKKFVGVQLCNSLRYKIYLSDSLKGTFYNIGDQRGHGEDHCQFVDSYLDGKTGQMLPSDQLPSKDGYFRAVRQEPVHFGKIGAGTHNTYVHWYECGTTIPGKW